MSGLSAFSTFCLSMVLTSLAALIGVVLMCGGADPQRFWARVVGPALLVPWCALIVASLLPATAQWRAEIRAELTQTHPLPHPPGPARP